MPLQARQVDGADAVERGQGQQQGGQDRGKGAAVDIERFGQVILD